MGPRAVKRLHPHHEWRLVVAFEADDTDALRASRAVKQLLAAGYGRVQTCTYDADHFQAMLAPRTPISPSFQETT